MGLVWLIIQRLHNPKKHKGLVFGIKDAEPWQECYLTIKNIKLGSKLNEKYVSFNNFKSFGLKIQRFSSKSITLVYDANSVGKSSLVHFSLLLEYIKGKGDIDLVNLWPNIVDHYKNTL